MEIDTLLKNTSRSLYLSVQALPKQIRPAFGIAYLLCRYADTIADTDLLPSQRRYYWVDRFAQIVRQQDPAEEKQLISEISGKSENPYEEALIKNLPLCLNAFNHLQELYKSFILEVVHAVCEGMKIDLSYFSEGPSNTPKEFETDADLAHYCRLMGGKPGRFWSQLIYHTASIPIEEEDFYQLGEEIGDSLQIVNILRDLPKDLQLGRCYFPRTDLDAHHLAAAQLTDGACSPRFEPIKQKWIQWGKQKLSKGKTYYSLLPKTQPRFRTSVAWPMLWTADTFFKLAQEEDLLNPAKRVKIPRSTIYRTMLFTPAILLSNDIFDYWLDKKLEKLP